MRREASPQLRIGSGREIAGDRRSHPAARVFVERWMRLHIVVQLGKRSGVMRENMSYTAVLQPFSLRVSKRQRLQVGRSVFCKKFTSRTRPPSAWVTVHVNCTDDHIHLPRRVTPRTDSRAVEVHDGQKPVFGRLERKPYKRTNNHRRFVTAQEVSRLHRPRTIIVARVHWFNRACREMTAWLTTHLLLSNARAPAQILPCDGHRLIVTAPAKSEAHLQMPATARPVVYQHGGCRCGQSVGADGRRSMPP